MIVRNECGRWRGRVIAAVVVLAVVAAERGEARAQAGRKKAAAAPGKSTEFDKEKEQFAEAKQRAIGAMLRAFDKRISEVQSAREWSKEERDEAVRVLTAGRQAFERTQELTPIFAMNEAYGHLTHAIRAARTPLAKKYEVAIKRLPKGDAGIARLTKELDALNDDVNHFDFLQPGKAWEGYRQDDATPARVEFNPRSSRGIRVVRDATVQGELGFTIKERHGDEFTAEVVSDKRSVVMDVTGSFNGSHLEMKTTGLSKGTPRYFEYAGELKGNVGYLSMQGIKPDGKPATGNVMIQLR